MDSSVLDSFALESSVLDSSVLGSSATYCQQFEQLFQQTFFVGYQTLLRGGVEEPLYQPSVHQPAESSGQSHVIYYREDYAASALHEVAHWCIAGEARRKLVDFGYWYKPDGRTADEQKLFEKVEVKPQTLEWIFSEAAGLKFQISADNLSGDVSISPEFTSAVCVQAQHWCQTGLPVRAGQFAECLAGYFGVVSYRELLLPDRFKCVPGSRTPVEAVI